MIFGINKIIRKSFVLNNLLVVLLITSLLHLSNGLVLFAKEEQLKERIFNIKTEIESLETEYEGNLKYQNSLSLEIKKIELENKNIQNILEQNDDLSKRLTSEVEYAKLDIELKNLELKALVREIQKKSKTSPVKTILSSESISKAISEVHNLSILESEISNKIADINNHKNKLENNLKDIKEANKNIQNMQLLLSSRQSYLDNLLKETQGKEELYQKKINSLQSERELLSGNKNPKPYYPVGGNGGEPECNNKVNIESKKLNLNGVLMVVPTYGYVSQKLHCQGPGHDAVDIANSIGTPIFAVFDGLVIAKGFESGGYGNYMLIKHTVNQSNFYSLYAHLTSPTPHSLGQEVSRGQQIGQMGSTGFSTGSHLHFALISESYEYTNSLGCNKNYGAISYCYNPTDYITF